jgi:phage-related baseplate assembly protein
MTTPLDLSAYRLPKPVVVRELDYEALLATRKGQFAALWDARRAQYPDLPPIDTITLETDPATILLEHAAFADLLFVAELNDAARVVRLIDFAAGSDLDLHAEEMALARLPGESDAALRARVKTRRRGSSAAGSDDWFAWHAMTASPDVAEIAISEPEGGLVDIAVRSRIGAGIPDAALTAAVSAVLTSRAVRPRCIRVQVSPAVARPVDVRAAVTLEPDALDEVFISARESFPASIAALARLGRDLTTTRIKSLLSPPGVYSVEVTAPAGDVVVAPNELITLADVQITLAGRAW